MSLNTVFDVPLDYQPLPNGTGVAVYPDSTRVQAQFTKVYELNVRASESRGIEIWDEYEVILLKAFRDTNIVSHRANEQHRKQFAAQYKKFQAGEAGELGTPLDKLYDITARQVAQLAHHGIFTIEQASLMDEALAHEHESYAGVQRKAQLWLKSKQGMLSADSAIKEAEILRVEVREKDEELDRLRAEILALKEKKSKKKKDAPCDE